MKTMTKVLLGVLILSGAMPLMAGAFALFNQPQLMQMFHFTASSPDLEKSLVIIGALMVAVIGIHAVAIYWVTQNKAEGFTLSFLIGAFILCSALFMLIGFNMYKVDESVMVIIDTVKGALIMSVSYSAAKNR